ncbi:MAG: hypothetical protein ACRDRL_15245 [Sciscionella sp.]
MTDFTSCMDPECGLPAEVVDEFVLPSTSGPVLHRATLCVGGHRYCFDVRD